ncbi:MAG: hypothetical protein N2445_09150, partial [Acidobacteria bacterium]|nr:hypothetical protein [Acidobacteriota bacterium]
MGRQNILSGEKGATFLTILVMLFLLAIFLLWAVQPASTVMQREKEAELIFRGEQICEALRNYQKDHGGGFPSELKELLKRSPKNVPYLRRLYKNPFDPEGKWCYLAPGTTSIRYKEDGSKEILPSGGVAQQTAPSQGSQNQPGDVSGKPGSQMQVKVLPFTLDGKEGLPILGVYAKHNKPAFRKYLDSNEISEW